MKTRCITLSFLLSTLSSCFQHGASQRADKDPQFEECFEMPMRVPPFLDVPIAQARALAKRENKRLMVLIIEPERDLKTDIELLGIRKESLQQWEKDFVCVVVDANQKSAKALMDEHYIQALPASIKFDRGSGELDEILYGRVWAGNKPYLSEAPVNKLLELYEAGDKEPRLINQILHHLNYLNLQPKERDPLWLSLQNDYMNSLSNEDYMSYEGYKILKRSASDLRLDIFTYILDNRERLNDQYHTFIQSYDLTHKVDADRIILNAIRKSLEKAVSLEDQELYNLALEAKEELGPDYIDPPIAQSVLRYQLKKGTPEEVAKAALQYFQVKENWSYSREFYLMEAGARSVYQVSDDPEALKQAASWLDVLIAKDKPNPSRYELYAALSEKLGNDEKANRLRAKQKVYAERFQEFVGLYKPAHFPIALDTADISKSAYRKLGSIPSTFEIFTDYIRVEGSLFKQGEKIEPIAHWVLKEGELILLSRVHLRTGSLLPVSHFRSYYIQARFSLNGAFLGRKYVDGSEIIGEE